MRVFNDLSDLKAEVGTEFGVSEWSEITQDRIDKFAEATGDEQWIDESTRNVQPASSLEAKRSRMACFRCH